MCGDSGDLWWAGNANFIVEPAEFLGVSDGIAPKVAIMQLRAR